MTTETITPADVARQAIDLYLNDEKERARGIYDAVVALTGWFIPAGGTHVTLEEAACAVWLQRYKRDNPFEVWNVLRVPSIYRQEYAKKLATECGYPYFAFGHDRTILTTELDPTWTSVELGTLDQFPEFQVLDAPDFTE